MSWRVPDILGRHPLVGYLLLAVLCLALYVPGLTSLPPIDRDEARFAQASRQMLESGDLVDIRFQDEPRYKKPVGIYWLQAAAGALTGAGDRIWPYRLPSLLGALTAVLLTAWAGGRLFGRRTGFVGAAVLASSLLLAVEARLAKTDAALLAAICLAQGTLAIAYLRSRRGEPVALGTQLLFWAAIGIGALLKGPIILLVSGTTALVLAVIERSGRWLLSLRPAIGVPLAVAIVLPWLAVISWLSGGQFWQDSVGTDLLAKVAAGQESHGAPPGTYLALLSATFWPFSLLALLAAPWVWRHRREPAIRFCLAWLLPTWIVFEAIPTKLPHYVLPTYPALALLVAAALVRLPERASRAGRLLFAIGAPAWLLWAAAFCVTVALAPWLLGERFDVLTVAGGILALLLAGGAVLLLHRQRPVLGLGALGVLALVLYAIVFGHALPGTDPLWLSARAVAAVRAADTCAGGMQLASAGYHEPSLVFLAGRETLLVDGAAAGRLLISEPCSLALVNEREQQSFREALSDAPVESLAVVSGVNYSKGRREQLTLYRLRPQSSARAGPVEGGS